MLCQDYTLMIWTQVFWCILKVLLNFTITSGTGVSLAPNVCPGLIISHFRSWWTEVMQPPKSAHNTLTNTHTRQSAKWLLSVSCCSICVELVITGWRRNESKWGKKTREGWGECTSGKSAALHFVTTYYLTGKNAPLIPSRVCFCSWLWFRKCSKPTSVYSPLKR